MPMQMNEASRLVHDLIDATVNHYKAVNGIGRKSGAVAYKSEYKAICRILSALTDSTPTEDEINNIMG